MKVCDITQFWSPTSGGVKRYISEKIRHVRERRLDVSHLLIIPGEKDEVLEDGPSRTYVIRSPYLSEQTGYRLLLRLEEIDRILAAEKPDIIECADPYQVGWRVVRLADELQIPAVAFYHSHMVESYLRPLQNRIGSTLTEWLAGIGRDYTANLYNRFDATLIPAESIVEELSGWGIGNARLQYLGLDRECFQLSDGMDGSFREMHGIPSDRFVFLTIGRLAAEKNTRTLWEAFRALWKKHPDRFHLVVVGDGLQLDEVEFLQRETGAVTWIRYCADPTELARIYQAADVFVHPGIEETFGLVALEAQGCGKFVLGFQKARLEAARFVSREDWARENTAESLAEAMERVSQRADLPEEGVRLSKLVHQHFDWANIFARLFDFYAEIIQKGRRHV